MKYLSSVLKSVLNIIAVLCILAGVLLQTAHAANVKAREPRLSEPAAAGSILPNYRIVGYYGNFLSSRMGVLGEYPPEQMLSMLKAEMRKWAEADPDTPVKPAIEYIAVVAQKDAGNDGKYRARMSDSEIQKAIHLAEQVNGIVILDVQVGLSNLQAELPHLEPYLKLPNVMLGIDPEFSMPGTSRPGTRIGTVDARDINYAIEYMTHLVKEHDLPPKVLIVHRFTKNMVTNHHNIELTPEVQVVMNMDGWGPQRLKKDSYRAYIAAEPVQYTGIKLFYKNDLKQPSTGLMTPNEILNIDPKPMFILYQ